MHNDCIRASAVFFCILLFTECGRTFAILQGTRINAAYLQSTKYLLSETETAYIILRFFNHSAACYTINTLV